MFGTFKVVAGIHFQHGSHHQFNFNTFNMLVVGKFFRESIDISQVEQLELATEDSVKRLGGTVGWGAIGGALLGPVGLLAGLLVGGRKKETTFICVFKDGRKFMATTPSKVYTAILASRF